MGSLVRTVLRENVQYIIMNRPEVYNSVNYDLALELISALKASGGDDNIRAIVLTGSGKSFCAGQDLKEASAEEGVDHKKIIYKGYNVIIGLIRQIEKPIIAAVNGIAAGAGASIALACDIVVAAESASFIQAFSKIGLIPDSGGTYFLPRLIGFQKALALTLLAEPVTAIEAERLGMIYKALKDDELEEFVDKMAYKLSKMPTKALGKTKLLYNESFQNSLSEQLNREGEIQLQLVDSYDAKEGVRAFIEKRRPKFRGQ